MTTAVSVRATNVYEEKSLGVFEPEEEVAEPDDDSTKPADARVAIWGKYLMRHVRRQLSFGNPQLTVVCAPCSMIMTSRYVVAGMRIVSHLHHRGTFMPHWTLILLRAGCSYSVIQRDNLMNAQNTTWFNIFSVCQCCPLRRSVL